MMEKNDALEAEKKYRSTVEDVEDYIEHFDILETITNVGNDEVFTPRRTVDKILSSLPEEVWSNPDYKWLNPASKNGIFEREIALRLDKGLESIIPDMEKRRKHILQDMIFSFGQTKFTSSVARRTLYYCSEANRKCDGIKAPDGHYVNGYAIGNGTWFSDEEGNIKTPSLDHTLGKDGKCVYCGINKDSQYLDTKQREKYAYEFIHIDSDKLLTYLQDRFFKGDREMKFDIIIGNPPYQLSDGGAGASSMPIYQKFVCQAITLNPKYLCMIIPSRWMTGGKGLDGFRSQMINDRHIKSLEDFIDPKTCFPNNDIKGGVCFFLRDRDYDGKCHITSHSSNGDSVSDRYLKEDGVDIFIRDEKLIGILRKVKVKGEATFDTITSPLKPYGLRGEVMYNASKFELPEFSNTKINGGYRIYGLDEKMNRIWKYMPSDYPIPIKTECLHKYKVFIARAYGCGAIGEVPSTPVLSTPVLSTPEELCSETFLEIGPFESEEEAGNVIKYIRTKFFRCLVGIQKQTQDASKRIYKFVPILDFSSNKDVDWNLPTKNIDEILYKRYNLSQEEISFIENNIEEMK